MLIPIISNAATISPNPVAWATTDGDILAGTVVKTSSGNAIAIGGNFRTVIQKDGKKVAAQNLAVIRESDGVVLYSGKANNYVRALAASGTVLYVGGDFTSLGSARNHIGAINISGWTINAFNPGSSNPVRALQVGNSIFSGTAGGIKSISFSGSVNWTVNVTQGPVRTLLISNDKTNIFVGGQFETIAGVRQHGLAKLASSTGKLDTVFKPALRPDSENGSSIGTYDGNEILSMAYDANADIILGGAGAIDNTIFKVRPTDGAFYWEKFSEGDVQAVARVDNDMVVGYHRNHINLSGNAWPYFGAQIGIFLGEISPWNPGLSGNQSNADGGNNGIQAIVSDPSTRKLFLLGAFTKWGQSCDVTTVFSCTDVAGTKSLKSIAVFTY